MGIEKYLNKITNADCLDVMQELPDKSIDLILTDAPYGIKMAKNTNICSNVDFYGKNKKGFYTKELHKSKDWDDDRPPKIYFDEMVRVSKNQIFFGGNYFADYLKPSRGWIFWDKKEHQNQGQNFADGELAYTSFDRNLKKYIYGWIGLDYVNNSKTDKKIHPTQKPLKLFEMILRDYAEPLKYNNSKGFKNGGYIVADFFSGSGTTAVACHNLGLDFIAVEKDAEYFKLSVERLENARSQLKLF